MKKRFLALMLSLSIVFSTAATINANENKNENSNAKLGTSYNVEDVKKARAELNEEKEVNAIITLKESSNQNFSNLKTDAGKKARIAETKVLRDSFKAKLDNSGIQYKIIYEYDFLFAGFSIETAKKNLKEIEKIEGVDTVEISNEYSRPLVTTEKGKLSTGTPIPKKQFRSADSNDLIKLSPELQKTHNGQGRVVAVLDSGIDVNHPILQVTDVTKGMFPNAEAMKNKMAEVGINYGSWRNDKVVYAHNYYTNADNVKEAEEHSHGMHVSGTAVGNPKTKQGFVTPDGKIKEEFITGVAPEAQLIFMNVFNGKGNTFTHAYAKAVEDSVKLGADSVNLSLGSPNGTAINVGKAMDKAITYARSMGSIVTIAAGNDGHYGYGQNLPVATNPDYGTLGSPGVAKDALTVAAMNTTVERTNVVTVNNETLRIGPVTFGEGQKDDFLKGEDSKEYDFVVVPGVGESSDFDNLDVNGKVAVIQRGKTTFASKIVNAHKKGAIGVIIYNHETGGDVIMGMDFGPEKNLVKIPSVFMGHSNGKKLEALKNGKVTFNSKLAVLPYADGGTLTDFSSYGYSTDGEFKPDITAPGGLIYSSINNDKYTSMNGTSMATPHVAGAVPIVRKALMDKKAGFTGTEEYDVIKALMMSTADPVFDKGTSNYVSPRKQGAGALNVAKAVSSNIYVVNKADNMAKVALRNLDSAKFDFTVKLVNFGNTEYNLKYSTVFGTDEVKDGLFQLKTRTLGTIEGETITVPAKGSTEVTITVDATKFDGELSKLMPNGYFLEGFVFFKDANDNQDVISIPFSGLKGNWQNLPLWEKPIYDFDLSKADNPDRTMYAGNLVQSMNANMTSLVTLENNNFAFPKKWDKTGEFNPNGDFNLHGEYNVIPAGFDSKTKTFMKDKIAFSPNGDGNKDTILFRGVFYRNTQYLFAEVYKEGEKTPVFTSGTGYFSKNSNTNKADAPKSNVVIATEWFGTDNNKQNLPDGKYKYVVKGNSTTFGSDVLSTEFDVILDRVAPVIEKPVIANQRYKPVITDELSGFENSVLRIYYNNQYKWMFPDSNGEFDVPNGTDLSKSFIVAYDYAGNISKLMLDGTTFNEDPAPKQDTGVTPIFLVKDYKDGKGNLIPNSEKINMFVREELQKIIKIEYFNTLTNAYQVIDRNKVAFIEGKFILPEGKYRFTLPQVPNFYNPVAENVKEVTVQDGKFADVVFETTVNHHVVTQKMGELNVSLYVDGNTNPRYINFVSYVIKNEQGEIVDKDKLQELERVVVFPITNEQGEVVNIDFKRLPYSNIKPGKYTLEVTTHDTGLKIDKKVIEFVVEEGKLTHVKIESTEIYSDIVNIRVNGLEELPEGVKVKLVNKATNETVDLKQSKFNERAFSGHVELGDYTVVVEVPDGYELDRNNFGITIKGKIDEIVNISKKVDKPNKLNVFKTDDGKITVETMELDNTYKLKADKVENTFDNDSDLEIYDIYFVDKDGNRVPKTPVGEYKVKMVKGKDAEVIKVHYIDDNNNKESIEFKVDGNVAEFKTTHFSKYALEYKKDDQSNPNQPNPNPPTQPNPNKPNPNPPTQPNPNKPENPGTNPGNKGKTLVKTGHGVGYLAVMSAISMIGLAGTALKKRKK